MKSEEQIKEEIKWQKQRVAKNIGEYLKIEAYIKALRWVLESEVESNE